jgi:hypothetical protein
MLHMFTYSRGYHKDSTGTAVSQLERFTEAGRNTIRRSLKRLIERGWIVEYSGAEPGGMYRGWVVRHPDPTAKPHRGSKLAPSKESIKQTLNKTLSLETDELREYFASIKSRKNRESELRKFQGLLEAYSESEIALAFKQVRLSRPLQRAITFPEVAVLERIFFSH